MKESLEFQLCPKTFDTTDDSKTPQKQTQKQNTVQENALSFQRLALTIQHFTAMAFRVTFINLDFDEQDPFNAAL